MLDPATKRWEDQSTTRRFKFLFFCDCCGKGISSPEYEFHSGFKPKIIMSEAERQARGLIWQRDHDAAYERANLYMLSNHLHTCEVCGDNICDGCAWVSEELEGGVCCEKCFTEKRHHGFRMWSQEE